MLNLRSKYTGSNYTVKYDAWNRLSTVADGSTVIQTNRYDGLHRRVSRESNTTGVRHFYWNESWQCVEERTGISTTADRQYVWHPYYIDALAISYSSSGTAHYYVQDGNFNVTAAMDSSGAVVERYSTTPYGECIVLNADFTLDSSSGGDGLSDIANEFTYTGRRLDVETGLYQYRHRYYHAQLGRFVNRDPIGYEGSKWNLYECVDGNPIDNVDPSGLERVVIDKLLFTSGLQEVTAHVLYEGDCDGVRVDRVWLSGNRYFGLFQQWEYELTDVVFVGYEKRTRCGHASKQKRIRYNIQIEGMLTFKSRTGLWISDWGGFGWDRVDDPAIFRFSFYDHNSRCGCCDPETFTETEETIIEESSVSSEEP